MSHEGWVDDVTVNLAGVKKLGNEADDGINVVPHFVLSNTWTDDCSGCCTHDVCTCCMEFFREWGDCREWGGCGGLSF